MIHEKEQWILKRSKNVLYLCAIFKKCKRLEEENQCLNENVRVLQIKVNNWKIVPNF